VELAIVPHAMAKRLTARVIRATEKPAALVLEGLGEHHRLNRPAPRCHRLGIAHHRGEGLLEWI
jgi:hypothetical protein